MSLILFLNAAPADVVVSMEATEDAIWSWVVASSQVQADHVFWSDQNAPRPSGQWISLDMVSIEQVGQDWLDTHDAASPSPGAELEQSARGVRRLTVSIQCFAGAALGTFSPTAVLRTVIARARLESQQKILRDGGLGFSKFTPITAISGPINQIKIEARAVVHAQFYMASEVVETSTYISTVNATNQIVSPSQVITVAVP